MISCEAKAELVLRQSIASDRYPFWRAASVVSGPANTKFSVPDCVDLAVDALLNRRQYELAVKPLMSGSLKTPRITSLFLNSYVNALTKLLQSLRKLVN